MKPISTAARRIAQAHNQCVGNLSGGKLVFDADGEGGEWYSANAYGFGPGDIVVTVRSSLMSLREAQNILDRRKTP